MVGFTFDDNNDYEVLTDVLPTESMTVVPPPVISESTLFTVNRWMINNITIHVSRPIVCTGYTNNNASDYRAIGLLSDPTLGLTD